MERKTLKVSVNDLQLGMFVSALDRPWLETPFLLQGFLIKSPDDINELRQHCSYVYIDILKGRAPLKVKSNRAPGRKSTRSSASSGRNADKEVAHIADSLDGKDRREYWETVFPHRTLKTYPEARPMEEELDTAQKVFKDLNVCVTEMMVQIEQKAVLEVKAVKDALNPMIDSVMRNPDACIWLARMKNRDSYTYKHSMAASVWAVALGRQLGLPRIDLSTLATGALLIDIGKLQLPEGILSKPARLSRGEFEIIKTHVEIGVKMLKDTTEATRVVLEMIATHHERHNGKGYPKKLKGTEIPIFGRIAAIADCYDAMTSERSYAPAVSPSFAVRKLYEWRDIDFQAELVEEFIQAIGIYPAGTLVELSTGEVGIVIAENRERRLRPKVLLLLDEQKHALKESLMLNLRDIEYTDTGEPLDIIASLEPGAYGISPDTIYL